MFLFKKRDSGRRKTIERLYGAIVAQTRMPVFYTAYGVPDTVEGRFDFLVLHMHLVNERLATLGEAGMTLGQELLDLFFEDMDGSLREIGIGDLTVPKKMRTLAEAYLGRSALYGPAIAQHDESALAAAIARNVLSGADTEAGRALAGYAMEAARRLNTQPLERFLDGVVEFPIPEQAASHVR